MKTIHKYPVRYNEDFTLTLPKGARVVHFAEQNSSLHIWAEVTPDNPPIEHRFAVHGTGHPIDPTETYIATCFDGPFVWHLYEKGGME